MRKDLEPILRCHDIEFFSFQKGPAADELAASRYAREIRDVSSECFTFADTAAAMHNLDLIISVDTAATHLAGALGLPVWTMIPAPPDYRWMLKREDSPWYPTMRLFRQPKPAAWADVIERVSIELGRFVREIA